MKEALKIITKTTNIFEKVTKCTFDFELGHALCDLSDAVNENPEILEKPEIKEALKELKKIGDKQIKYLVKYGKWGWSVLKSSLGPGQELFPDKKVHWWWWWHEEFMTEEEIKRFNKYLETRG